MNLEGLSDDYVEFKKHIGNQVTALTYSGMKVYYKSIEKVDFIKLLG